jgi:two-component system sensor histidine kinase AlgZ
VSVLLCVVAAALVALAGALGGRSPCLLAALIAAAGAVMLYAIDDSLGYGMVPEAVSVHRFALGSAAITALIVAIVLRYLYAVDSWQAQVRASARAEADALQARIKPHFLFKQHEHHRRTGATRPGGCRTRGARPVRSVPRGARRRQGRIEPAEEVELAERYLSIEQLRLGERLQVRWRRTEPLPWDLPLPRLVLQPLVENAVLHGISRLPEGGVVDIELLADAQELRVGVHNPAPPPRERESGGSGAQHAPAQHRPPPRLCLRAAGEDGRALARGLLSGRVPRAVALNPPLRQRGC